MTHILIVDDVEQNIYMLKVLLQGHGYEVETAVNGEEALEKARIAPPKMIISDILMPTMDGFTLCRHWKQDETLKNIPFIFYTATYTNPQDKEFALSLGADQFLIKPLDPEDLIGIIKKVAAESETNTSITPDPSPEVEEITYFKQYNETLIRKLEDKMLELEQANQRLQTLYQVSTKLAVIKPQDELIYQALNAVIEIVGYEDAGFFTYDLVAKIFTLQAVINRSRQPQTHLIGKLQFNLGEERGFVGLCGQKRTPIVVNDTQLDSRWIPVATSARSALFVPVIYEDELFGVINFLSTEKNGFNDEDARNALTLASNIAIAIENVRLYERQKQYASRLEAEVNARTAELTVALEKAQVADRLKSQFISDVNHELRTPLSNIRLYLNLLERGSVDNRPQYMAVLEQEAQRLEYLIEDMLDLSRLDADKTVANFEPIDLNHVIGMLILERGELANENDLTLDFESHRTIPSILADKQLVFQVLSNLLINAINYTKAGDTIKFYTKRVEKADRTWVVAGVSDTGPGIAMEEQEKVFERFYRGKTGRESGSSGTGLGLAICKTIMERHGGLIEVQSVVGEGSTFLLYFPID